MRTDLGGWMPVTVDESTGRCRWRYVGSTSFDDPFFEDTIGRCLELGPNSSGPRTSSLDEMAEVATGLDALDPSAFVFHVSRCGSTLVSQLLGLGDGVVALSEVRFFDQLLRARHRPALADVVDVGVHLPAAIRIHGARRTGAERHVVVKLDSWHLAFHAELRRLYPTTPFVLLYRDPAAVVRSHHRRPGMHAVPGVIEPEVFGWTTESATPESRAEHLPRVLDFYYSSMLEAVRTDPGSLAVAYQPDMMSVVEAIADATGVELTAAHRQQMRARMAFHSKRPDEAFGGDGASTPGDDAVGLCQASHDALDRWRREHEASV